MRCTSSWPVGCCNAPIWVLQLMPGLCWQFIGPIWPLLDLYFSDIFLEAAVLHDARHALCAARAELVFCPPLQNTHHT